MPTAKLGAAHAEQQPGGEEAAEAIDVPRREAPTAAMSITAANMTRPPYLSVSTPTGNRNIAPVRTGVPISHPISALLKS